MQTLSSVGHPLPDVTLPSLDGDAVLLAALLTIATGVLLLPPDDAAAQRRSRDEGLFEGPLSVGLRTGRDWTEKASELTMCSG